MMRMPNVGGCGSMATCSRVGVLQLPLYILSMVAGMRLIENIGELHIPDSTAELELDKRSKLGRSI